MAPAISIVEPWIVAVTCAGLMLVSWLLAYTLGRSKLRSKEIQEGGSVLIDEACLAILGLMLAFTFAAAYSKYDNRNSKVADDASALRTLHHRCDLLPDPWRKELLPLAREAIQQRLVLLKPDFKIADFPALNAKGLATETQMMAIIKRMNQDKDASSLAGPLADAAFAVATSHESRLAAGADHVPMPVVALLILVSAISAFLLGRSQAIAGRTRRTTLTLIVMVTAIIYVTMDLESPLKGLIQTNQAPILRLADNVGITL